MQITYVKDSAGIKAGTVKTLPDKLAMKLVEMGIAVEGETPVEVDALGEIVEPKQATEPETRETKPHKGANNRKTK